MIKFDYCYPIAEHYYDSFKARMTGFDHTYELWYQRQLKYQEYKQTKLLQKEIYE